MNMMLQRVSRNQLPWQGWIISLTVFSLIVLLVELPSIEVAHKLAHSEESQYKNTFPLIQRNNSESPGHDVLVKCKLTTPHAKGNSSYHPAEGTIELVIHKTIAPLASLAFLSMVRDRHFDGNYIFRAVPGFIVQWGIESPASISSRKEFPKVDIDHKLMNHDHRRSNVRGTLNFAGGNSGTGQVYINRKDNIYLDKEGDLLPFCTISEESMKIVDAVYDGYKEGSGQVKALNNNQVDILFPKMSRIEKCWVDGNGA